jgi:hypothetical protein
MVGPKLNNWTRRPGGAWLGKIPYQGVSAEHIQIGFFKCFEISFHTVKETLRT